MTSFMFNMATLPMKSSRNEQRAVIVFVWAEKKCKSDSFWDASSIWRQVL